MITNQRVRKFLDLEWVQLTRNRLLNRKERVLSLLISDKKINEILYKRKKNKKLNLNCPETFSEKVLFLKLYYRNPLVSLCCDKYYVNEYVKVCGYEDILKKTYGVFSNPNEIDFSKMPEKYFLKCNHIQGKNFLINRNDDMDYDFIKKYCNILLKRNHYYHMREWGYKHVAPRIICEECLQDKAGNLPIDYKFYCFGGEPKYFMVSYGEFEHNVRNHKFDMEFNSIDLHFKSKSDIAAEEIVKPKNFDRMVEIATKLSQPFPHVRVDLYNLDGKIYFGELTFYSGGGFINVYSHEMDILIGSWIKLEDYGFDIVRS